MGDGLKVGYACQWYRGRPEQTWSGTAWHLRSAVSRRCTVIDVGPKFPRLVEPVAKMMFLRKQRDSWVSEWTQSRCYDLLAERQVRARSGAARVDAVLQVMDYAVTDQPFHVYQDLSHHLVLGRFATGNALPDEFNRLSISRLRAGLDRQRDFYQRAASVFCMSQWLADDLVRDGLAADKVHVVPPGAADHGVPPRSLEHPRTGSLVLVGHDAVRKGLSSVLAALPLVRSVYPQASLTVVGPREWPVRDTGPPDNVRLLGSLDPPEVARELARHDLFVMPSQWEGFGMAFCEALLAGLPCIGRADCAMPEIIQAPKYGAVVGAAAEMHVPAHELARAIIGILDDDAVYARVAADRDGFRRRYSWDTAAERMLDVIRG